MSDAEQSVTTPAAVEIRYRLEGADITEMTWMLFLEKARFVVFVGPLMVIGQIAGVVRDALEGRLGPSSFIVLGVVVLVLAAVFYGPRLTLKRLPEAARNVRVLLDEHGLHVDGGITQARLEWAAITSIKLGKLGAFFDTVGGGAIFVSRRHMPPRVQESIAQWSEWRGSTDRKRLPWALILWVILVLMFVAIYNLVAKP